MEHDDGASLAKIEVTEEDLEEISSSCSRVRRFNSSRYSAR